jgi:hypothetical protein
MINKKTILSLAIAGTLLTSPLYAANWLMLQGTEPDSAAPRIKMWGFIQTQYQKDMSDASDTDQYVPPKLIGPNLNSQSQFNINRARLGARGTGFPLDGKVNYFLLAEFGNNAITAPGGGAAQITDASITLNQIKGMRVRAGLFKTPGSEELLQAIHVFDYINFTAVGNQLLLERLPNRNYTANNGPVSLPDPTQLTAFDRPIAAARDVGIQLFDTFKSGSWEHSYAVMIGNGNGMNFGDNDDNKDTYLYWSSEQVYGGKGGRRQGLKLFAWTQTGKRQLDNTNDSVHNPQEFDRKRSGVGVKYLKKGVRVSAEYIKGDGMIFVGPDKATFDINPAIPPGNGENGTANGYYLDAGYRIPGSNWEVDARYDVYNRLTNDTVLPGGPNAGKGFEMQFKTLTLGAQYHINKKSRINIEYANRDYTAVDWDANKGPNANLDGVAGRFAIQLTHIF